MRLQAIALVWASLALPSSAEVCLKLPVVSDVNIRSTLTMSWNADPAAIAYCESSLNLPDLCPEPELTPECRSAMVELAGFGVVRVLSWRLDNDVLFGQVEVAPTNCAHAEVETSWLPVSGNSCVFRPRVSWP
jgi:hypothetical protein